MIQQEQTTAQVHILPGHDGVLSPYNPDRVTFANIRAARKDPTIRLARSIAIAPILMGQWAVDSTDGAPEGAAEEIERQILPFRDDLLRTSAFGCLDFGWQPFEKLYRIENDRAVLSKLKPLLQDYTEILVTPNGAYNGLRQRSEGTDVTLAVPQTLLISWDVEGTNWYGESTTAVAIGPLSSWTETDKAAQRYDKKLAGSHWLIQYPQGQSPYNGVLTDNAEIAEQSLKALQSSGGMAVPKPSKLHGEEYDGWDVKLLSTSGGSADFVTRLNYLDKIKVRAYGLPERAVLEGQFGTKAEAAAHIDMAIANVELRHSDIVRQVNRHVINQILRFNWGPMYHNTVFIRVMPLTDAQRERLYELYTLLLQSEDGEMEFDRIDREVLREQLGVPSIVLEKQVDVATDEE